MRKGGKGRLFYIKNRRPLCGEGCKDMPECEIHFELSHKFS